MTLKAVAGVMWPQDKAYQQLPGARGGEEGTQSLWREESPC